MGRRIPPYTNQQIHPVISVYLLIAFVAATMVILGALCGSKSMLRSRKGSKGSKASKPSSDQNDSDTEIPVPSTEPQERPPPLPESSTSPQSAPSPPREDEERNTGEDPGQSEPMFNFMPQEDESLPKKLIVKTRRRLSTSLSMRAGGTALAKMLSRKEDSLQFKQKKLKPEDSIWTKTIMLGEKCKVPHEEDAILYDDKGNRLSAYPVRMPQSLPVSRSNSFANRD